MCGHTMYNVPNNVVKCQRVNFYCLEVFVGGGWRGGLLRILDKRDVEERVLAKNMRWVVDARLKDLNFVEDMNLD